MLLLFCKLSDIIGVREREIEQRMPDHGHSSWEAQFNGLDKVSAYEGLFMDYEFIEYFTNAYYGCVVTSQSKQNVSCHESCFGFCLYTSQSSKKVFDITPDD